MQYPHIQFYKGSLVRLANGQLKQVEDLSSDDFIESARLATNVCAARAGESSRMANSSRLHDRSSAPSLTSAHQKQNHQRLRFNFQPMNCDTGSSGTLDENNNSVFNSPEPTSASYGDSPQMEAEEYDDEDIDVELDVVTNDDQPRNSDRQQAGLSLIDRSGSLRNMQQVSELVGATANGAKPLGKLEDNRPSEESGDFYVDSSVVRDFLEVGPIQQQLANGCANLPPASSSPASSTGSLTNQSQPFFHPKPSTSASPNSPTSPHRTSITPPVMPQITSAAPATASQTVLVKFFLETSRNIAFIEVPIEHPFFVLHRGWSSWSPQMTYDTFGLKCRKLKIGDTCISLIRRRTRNSNSHNDSDHCNILFSSIKINE